MTPRTAGLLATLGVLVVGGLGVLFVKRGELFGAAGGSQPPLAPGERVLLLGDSIGVGTAQHLADELAAAGATLDAEPHVGWTAKKVRTALDADPSLVGDVVVISLGSNDWAMMDPTSEADDVHAIVATARARGARRVLWVIGPNYAIDPPPPATPAKQQAFRALVEAEDVELVEPNAEVVAQIAADRIHLPPRGYAALARQIATLLTA